MRASFIGFILGILAPGLALGALSEQDRALITPRNILVNPGFEAGKANWTASGGTFTITTTTANISTGLNAASWDSNSAGQTFTSSAVSIPAGLYAQNGVLRCRIQVPSGQATHTIGVWDGTTLTNATTITSSTVYTATNVNFIIPSSGTLAIRLTSVNANEPSINIDDCYLGLADNIGTVAQAQFIGSGYIAGTALCDWSRTNTALGPFGTDTDCPGPTVESNPGPGTLQTTDTDLPRFTFNNLPDGTYFAQATMSCYSSATSVHGAIAISDGTSTGTTSSSADVNSDACSAFMTFTYSNSGNRSFEIYGSANSSGTVHIENVVGESVRFSLFRYPSSTELLYQANQLPQSWSGYHDTTCSWAVTSTSYADFTADASCALTERTNRNFGSVTTSGSVKPAITFNPVVGRRYWVCATGSLFPSSAVNAAVRLWDGTTTVLEVAANTGANRTDIPLCGIYSAASSPATLSLQAQSDSGAVNINSGRQSQSSLEWSIFDLDSVFPSPILLSQNYQWSGHFADSATNYWSRANTAIGDMTVNGTPVLVEDYNSSMGSVTIAGSNLPGVTFSAPRTGTMKIKTTLFNQVPGGTLSCNLVEAGGSTLDGSRSNSTASMSLSGFKDVISGTTYTFKLQCAITTGTGYIGGVGTPGYSLSFNVEYVK